VNVNGDKVVALMNQYETPRYLHSFVGSLVSLAKQTAFGVDCPSWDEGAARLLVAHHDLEEKLGNEEGSDSPEDLLTLGLQWASRILTYSNRVGDTQIDFDDMIYLPLLNNTSFFQQDWVLIDEAQDTNRARRLLAHRMLRPNGRLIAVGDPRQAIYGFTGADADALDIIGREFNATWLPLTITYRCPKAVVQHAQQWVTHIEAADSAPEGMVGEVSEQEFRKLTPKITDAVLCRNTKPLVQLAFDLIRRSVPCHVEGRDIGRGLEVLATRWKTAHTMLDLQLKLDEYLAAERTRLLARGNDAKLHVVQDKVETLFVLMERFNSSDPLSMLTTFIRQLFKDTDGRPAQTVTLSTVHKSKGREWDRVFLLGRNKYMPSAFAKQEWQIEQEENLIYVAVTRAMRVLIEVNVPTKEAANV
jgi:superfamily I DNA/RNA helicase